MSEVSESLPPGLSEGGLSLPEDAVIALDALETLESVPINEHVAVFEDIHATLRGALNRPTDG